MNKNEKKSQILGMNFSTARARLERDVLVSLALAAGHKCFRCNGELSRENFSIEHTEPWQSSADPITTFFDLKGIAFSHHTCNSGAASRPTQVYGSVKERQDAKNRRRYCPDKRRDRYLRNGT